MLALLSARSASAQVRPQPPSGNRIFNPYTVQFVKTWDASLPDPVKLIELGDLGRDRRQSLIQLVGGQDVNDPKRRLLVTHWDGFRFATDSSADFTGAAVDALFVGFFRSPKTIPAAKPARGKSAPPPSRQIITSEGVYEWLNGALTRAFASPSDLRLALLLDKAPAQLLTGSGDTARLYEVGDNDSHLSTTEVPSEGSGSVRFGVGTQEFPGAETMEIASGIRYVQSYWDNQYRLQIGLIRGTASPTPDAPHATTGDRLVVYTPKFASKDKAFWATKQDDLEESWRSEPLVGRVLDVRVGDPKNEGKLGILVLTAENKDKVRRLTFFMVKSPFGFGAGGPR